MLSLPPPALPPLPRPRPQIPNTVILPDFEELAYVKGEQLGRVYFTAALLGMAQR